MTVDIDILFLENDVGKAGLSPTIKIVRNSDHVAVIGDVIEAAVTDEDTEIDGHYIYEFTTANGHDTAESYFVRVDSVTLTGDERYAWAKIPAYLGEYTASIAAVQADTTAIEALVTDIAKLTGYKVTKAGNIITIYESDGTTVWRQYDLANDGRVQL